MVTRAKYQDGRLKKSGTAEIVSAGVITSNQQVANTVAETSLISETVAAGDLDSTGMHFRVTLVGEISSTGTGDCTLTLRYGTTDILELATVSLADVDDAPFRLTFYGRVHTTGATGKVVATAIMDARQTTPLIFSADTANTGVTVDLTAAGSLNVTAEWDAASADNDIIVTHGTVELLG